MSVTDLGGVASSLSPNLDHEPFHSWIYLQKIWEPSMKILISESETDGVRLIWRNAEKMTPVVSTYRRHQEFILTRHFSIDPHLFKLSSDFVE